MENLNEYEQLALTYMSAVGTKVIVAIAFWIVGRWLIGVVGRLLQGLLGRQKVDPTLVR